MVNILLNGMGRIGKAIVRIANDNPNINIVAINEINPNISNIAYSINYDTTYGTLKNKYTIDNKYIISKDNKIRVFNVDDLSDINFKKYNIDIILEASGSKINIKKYEELSIKRVFLTHPNKNADINIILGVNENMIDKTNKIVSTSSCNATALLPILKIIDDTYGLDLADISTIHPLLGHQKTLDSLCIGSQNRDVQCNFEFGRSALNNIIPTATTTIDACSYIIQKMNKTNISSNSFRVPTQTVGAINVCMMVNKHCTLDNLNELFYTFENKQKYKILRNTTDACVSSDFKQDEFTTIIDHRFTNVIQNKMIKLVLWYDNEWGYASKVIDIISLYDRQGY